MSLIQALFYVFALLTVSSALGILLFRNILYSASCLLLTFLGVAGLYVLAGADLIAVVQIVIYVGGVLVLLIFGVMLTQKSSQDNLSSKLYNRFIGISAAGSLFGLLMIAILKANVNTLEWIVQAQSSTPSAQKSSVSGIGIGLMTDFVLPFEVAGILLLVALIGAAYIAKRN
jgi:NADH-quinone oxidoreductase subunit J